MNTTIEAVLYTSKKKKHLQMSAVSQKKRLTVNFSLKRKIYSKPFYVVSEESASYEVEQFLIVVCAVS